MRHPDVWKIVQEQEPDAWTLADVRSIKLLFRQYRPEVPEILAVKLWRFWQQTAPDKLLFEEEEDNIALLLHARAYDEPVPNPGDASFFGQLLHEKRDLYSPLISSSVRWGPRAILSDAVLASLSSPI